MIYFNPSSIVQKIQRSLKVYLIQRIQFVTPENVIFYDGQIDKSAENLFEGWKEPEKLLFEKDHE